jgi:hypothetical protein
MQPVTGIYLVDSLDKNKTCTNTCLGQDGRPAHAVDMPDMQGSVRWDSIQIYRIYIYFFFGPYSTLYLSRVNSGPGCTAMTQCRQFETNISRKGIVQPPQSQFQHSCVCERFMYSLDRSAVSAAGNMWTDPGIFNTLTET